MPHEDAGNGFIGKNDYKKTDNQPDYTGKVSIDGKEYRLSGWSREKEGRKYLSLAVTVHEPRVGGQDFSKREAPRVSTPAPTPANSTPVQDNNTDDLPF